MTHRITAAALLTLMVILPAACRRSEDYTPPGPTPPGTSDTTTPAPATQPGATAAGDATPQMPTDMIPPDFEHPPVTDGPMTGGTLDALEFTVPEPWVEESVTSAMRAAQFRLHPAEGAPDGTEDATLVVFHFGPRGAGMLEANIDRWCRQFAQPDGSDPRAAATIEQQRINNFTVTTVDLTGTVVADSAGTDQNKPGYRLLAAIVETDAGPYYFKLVGPESVVNYHDSHYAAVLHSLRPPASDG